MVYLALVDQTFPGNLLSVYFPENKMPAFPVPFCPFEPINSDEFPLFILSRFSSLNSTFKTVSTIIHVRFELK